MSDLAFVLIYFVYGLAVFSMGLVVLAEGERAADERLRKGLHLLAAFGLVHGLYEWIEMGGRIFPHFNLQMDIPFFYGIRLAILTFSFLCLSGFGGYLLIRGEGAGRCSRLLPFVLAVVWLAGLVRINACYPPAELEELANVWTRYSLAIPAALLAAAGLMQRQRELERMGVAGLGRDAFWAASAFAVYGLVGQLFGLQTSLPPSTFLNEVLFRDLCGFPVQLLRAAMAVFAAFFVVRFLRVLQRAIESRVTSFQALRLEDSLANEALRGELFRQVVVAQESERQRIARDLHDETGQALTAIGLGLRGLAKAIRQGDIDRVVYTLRQLEGMAASSLVELQHLITDLRPSHLDDLGLPATLRWYSGKVQERSGLEIKVKVWGQERKVDTAIIIALFRIAQEALNNIVKHAQAAKVNILVNFESDGIRLRVRDDGRGFDVTAALNKKQGRVSLGLVGMQERATLLGGIFLISQLPGRGVLVEVKVPYHR